MLYAQNCPQGDTQQSMIAATSAHAQDSSAHEVASGTHMQASDAMQTQMQGTQQDGVLSYAVLVPIRTGPQQPRTHFLLGCVNSLSVIGDGRWTGDALAFHVVRRNNKKTACVFCRGGVLLLATHRDVKR